MPRKAKDIQKALLKKGFTEREGDHHFFDYYHRNKKTRVVTKLSHSSKEVSDGLLGAMARQIGLTGPEFRAYIDCTLSAENYKALLLERGLISP